MNEIGVSPNLEIIDMKEQRRARVAPALTENRISFNVVNEPGTISVESLYALDKCLGRLKIDSKASMRLVVEGEEDLLVLPVVAFFPQGSVVFYGQPNEGLVVVNIDESRENARKLLMKMGIQSLKQ
jgi:GTP-dependent dephospho-CoA kinase